MVAHMYMITRKRLDTFLGKVVPLQLVLDSIIIMGIYNNYVL